MEHPSKVTAHMSFTKITRIGLLSLALSQVAVVATAQTIATSPNNGDTNAPSGQLSLLAGLSNVFSSFTAANNNESGSVFRFSTKSSEPRHEHRPIEEVIRFDVEDATVYGLFDANSVSNANSVARASGANSVIGLRVEHPIERGLALNFELFQNTSAAQSGGSFIENTKAALRLRFKF